MDNALARIGDTIALEFSDLRSLEDATRIVLRLALAALLGGLLGIERESKGKAAGVRTHMLVAMGAAMFVLASQQFDIVAADMSRVLQGVIAGVGFLGAGTILKGDAESQVKGLTTAAGIWMTAAIGVAAGLGKESTAILATLLTLAIMASLPLFARLFERKADAPQHSVTPPEG
ncbi:MgtC/SapB family protein [Pseudorhodoferax soli]|uniref:Protein MgtC n=1 Tax=Pseudorhodoferax soli TaxID=545864 RepID=A0A368XHV4_9BURK|nr:MgtC/SapB family protein [Pseudorhodoferax soli]RCW67415.1 putative Mg2+ transporter-C (MgtC) family protein [Pseudorhodoferax soli]